jgi:splicing factor 3B subunit 1
LVAVAVAEVHCLERKLVLEATEEEVDILAQSAAQARILSRENEYQSKRLDRTLAPTEASTSTAYLRAMREQQQEKERIEQQRRQQPRPGDEKETAPAPGTPGSVSGRRRRWDMPTPDVSSLSSAAEDELGEGSKPLYAASGASEWEQPQPQAQAVSGQRRSRWDATPADGERTGKRSRWDATPVAQYASESVVGTPSVYAPSTAASSASARALTDEELDAILPNEGYVVLEPPAGYVPLRTPSRKLEATPSVAEAVGFRVLSDDPLQTRAALGITASVAASEDLPFSKPEDYQYFAKLLTPVNEETTSIEEAKERKILKLLLRIKNGAPSVRRVALRQLVERARDFGAGPLFDQILPLLMSPALEEAERHLLAKVIDRLLHRLEDAVRPYVHKILVVIEPLLIDEDYYARAEGREIIANLAKAAGLATMIATMRPDIDHVDEYVRNTTARAFAVVASALGVPALLPFLRAVCGSRKSWQARHTGAKIIQQLAMLMGVGVIPHLKTLVEALVSGIEDEQVKVRTMGALAVAALAEASAPYGIESFEPVLRPVLRGIRTHRGKALAAFLKAVGQLLGLMAPEQAAFYGRELLPTLTREFSAPDDEMRRIVLRVIRQVAETEGIPASLIRASLLDDFFVSFWVRKAALDRRLSRALLEATVSLTLRVGVGAVAPALCERLKDEAEGLRRLALEVLEAALVRFGAAEIGERTEELLIDGLVAAIQEPGSEESSGQWLMRGWGVVAGALGGTRMRPYLGQLSSLALWRLGNRSARIRAQAADLIAALAASFSAAGEETTLSKLALVLYENLGEEFPDVLASILGALKAIVGVVGLARMTPPVAELLPRMNPILRNRNERVQDVCIQLVGAIAERAGDAVSSREWMRIAFELLDLLKAQRKSVRMEAVRAFGSIARAIGPHDILAMLLSNLRVQERQNRVCTTVAIAVVAERCAPFTVLPALMNEYRVPELNVQNGVLKSLAFLFEYLGEASHDYIYAVTTLLEDALTDRDQVHRQLAANAIKSLSSGVFGHGCDDAATHLLNHLFPNIFETSAHVIMAVIEAIDSLRLAAGPGIVLQYLLQGLFHPARRVREIYWQLYNNLLIGAQESLVPAYPAVRDEDGRTYHRHVLDILL